MGKKDGGDEAKRARQDEEKRQAQIRQGTSRINSIFDGGTVATGPLDANAVYDPNATYYNADGTVWAPVASVSSSPGLDSLFAPTTGNNEDAGHHFSSGGNAAPARTPSSPGNPAADQFAKALKNGQLFSGAQTQTGFDDDFFNGLKKSYLDYADPQLEDQYGDANKQLTFALARSGNLDSSARAEKQSDLQKLYDTQKRAVADKALGYETSSRNAVEDARANLISTLNATGDQQGAVNSALARASALSQPPAYDPLGQLFVDFTNGLGIQAAQERSYAAGGPAPRYNTGLFGNAGRTVVRQ